MTVRCPSRGWAACAGLGMAVSDTRGAELAKTGGLSHGSARRRLAAGADTGARRPALDLVRFHHRQRRAARPLADHLAVCVPIPRAAHPFLAVELREELMRRRIRGLGGFESTVERL